jgi:hypothetical protein
MKVMKTNSEAGRFIRIKTHSSLDLRCKCMLMTRDNYSPTVLYGHCKWASYFTEKNHFNLFDFTC